MNRLPSINEVTVLIANAQVRMMLEESAVSLCCTTPSFSSETTQGLFFIRWLFCGLPNTVAVMQRDLNPGANSLILASHQHLNRKVTAGQLDPRAWEGTQVNRPVSHRATQSSGGIAGALPNQSELAMCAREHPSVCIALATLSTRTRDYALMVELVHF